MTILGIVSISATATAFGKLRRWLVGPKFDWDELESESHF